MQINWKTKVNAKKTKNYETTKLLYNLHNLLLNCST